MTAELLARLGATEVGSAGSQIREAHAQLDKTRCIGWLRATGMRPVSDDGVLSGSPRIPQSPQRVEKRVRAYLEEACDMHPVEDE